MLFAGVFVAGASSAQVRCTMPNGRVIEQQLSAVCPVGAVSGETFDGRPVEVQKKPEPKPKPVKAPPPAPQAVAPKPPPPAPVQHAQTEFDQAYLLCAVLRSTGATTCEVNTSMFQTHVIDITLSAWPGQAVRVCDEVKLAVRSHFQEIRRSSRGWELKIYHPMGDGSRPMAVCRI